MTAFEGEVNVRFSALYPFTYLCDGAVTPLESSSNEQDGNYVGACAWTITSDWVVFLTPTP